MDEDDDQRQLTVENISDKIKSKKDLYILMHDHLQFYLPSYEACNIKFLKQILSGEKKAFKSFNIRSINVPKYPELNVKDFLFEARKLKHISIYLPEFKDSQIPDRKYLFDIINTADIDWLMDKINQAHVNRVSIKNTEIKDRICIKADILEEIMESTFHSKTKGRAVYLLKTGSNLNFARRKRKKHQIEFDNKEESKNEDDFDTSRGSKRIKRSISD